MGCGSKLGQLQAVFLFDGGSPRLPAGGLTHPAWAVFLLNRGAS